MNLLKEIYHDQNLNINHGRIIDRAAVRGVVIRSNEVFMIYSNKYKDYKFPGGGIENGETHSQALNREIMEECGALVTNILKEIGKVIEYRKPKETDYDVFKMTSYYYLCTVVENYCELNLESYEKERGFEPVWITIDDAIKYNRLLIETREASRWTARDTFVLEYLRDSLR